MTELTPLLLLHGALGSRDQMAPLAGLLAGHRTVYALNLYGHGGEALPRHGLRMEDVAGQLMHIIKTQFSQPVDVFGYSMGGYAAAAVAARHPGLIRSLVTLGTKWTWSPEIATGELRMLDPAIMLEKAPALVSLISARHQPQTWEDIVEATCFLLDELGRHPLLGEDELSHIDIPVRILRGEADRMVSQEESLLAAGFLPQATCVELPGQKHPFELIDLQLLLPFLA